MCVDFGWAGRYLYIDLTNKEIKKIPLSQDLRKDYLGGRGIKERKNNYNR